MAVCPRCSQPTSIWQRDIFSGVCRKCMAATTPASLGCGTLIIIAVIVAFVTRPGMDELESHVFSLQKSVDELKESVDAQTTKIEQLRMQIENLEAPLEGANVPEDRR